jgi:hypothetical protein
MNASLDDGCYAEVSATSHFRDAQRESGSGKRLKRAEGGKAGRFRTNRRMVPTTPSADRARSIPVTWVTVYSAEHTGNTFGPKGFSIGSSLQVSSSK